MAIHTSSRPLTEVSKEQRRRNPVGEVLLVQSIENVKRKSPDFTDIVSWIKAFGILVAIAGKLENESVPGLMAHMCKVIRAARVCNSHWQEYDRAYRRKAAAMGQKDWSHHDADLWDRYITGPSQAPMSSDLTPSRPSNQRFIPYQKSKQLGSLPLSSQWKKSVCFSHNFDNVCARSSKGIPCPYAHICYSCGRSDHKKPECPSELEGGAPSKESDSQSITLAYT